MERKLLSEVVGLLFTRDIKGITRFVADEREELKPVEMVAIQEANLGLQRATTELKNDPIAQEELMGPLIIEVFNASAQVEEVNARRNAA